MKLTLNGVSVTIGDQKIVSAVALAVEAAEFVALVGPNGSGKSTLLRTVYRALRPAAGEVLLDGDDVWRLSAREVARRRAVVTQHNSAGTDFSVRQMVELGRTPHQGRFDRSTTADRLAVDEALTRVDLTWAQHRMFATLSGGERQRVLVARALAQQAPLIVLDEPTNHLDVRAQLDLLHLVRDQRVATLAALHDLNHATAYADRVAVLAGGELVGFGEPHEVLTPDLIAEVFGVRAHIGPHPLTGKPHIALAVMSSPRDRGQ